MNPPHDIAAEQAVLGAVLLSNVALPQLIIDVGLTPEAFYRHQHGLMWSAMVAMAMRGEEVDTLTLRSELESTGAEFDVREVDELPAMVPSVSSVLSYARRVIDLAEWRGVLEAAMELEAAVREESAERRQGAESTLMAARRKLSTTRSPKALAEDVWRHLKGDSVKTWPTPWPSLNDAMSGGLRSGEVTLLGGWSSMGKSIVGDSLLRHCAEDGAAVHAYINEMAPTVRALRLLSSMTEVQHHKLAQPSTLTPEELQAVVKHLGSGLPFGISQVGDWSAQDIARDMRFRKWDVCLLDLIHRLPFKDERELATISTTLNGAAQMSGSHLVAVVHLNEGRSTGATAPPPVLRDIRGSGMLKNDADNVLFIHREEEESEGFATKSLRAVLYLAKCRNGRLAKIELKMDPRRSRFLEATA